MLGAGSHVGDLVFNRRLSQPVSTGLLLPHPLLCAWGGRERRDAREERGTGMADGAKQTDRPVAASGEKVAESIE